MRTHYESLARVVARIRESGDDSLPLRVWPDARGAPSPRAVHYVVAREMVDEGLLDAEVRGDDLLIHGLTDEGRRTLLDDA